MLFCHATRRCVVAELLDLALSHKIINLRLLDFFHFIFARMPPQLKGCNIISPFTPRS